MFGLSWSSPAPPVAAQAISVAAKSAPEAPPGVTPSNPGDLWGDGGNGAPSGELRKVRKLWKIIILNGRTHYMILNGHVQ